jgi:tRNA threonylcarbamoyladenosine dehydratase
MTLPFTCDVSLNTPNDPKSDAKGDPKSAANIDAKSDAESDADLERRFGGLRRLYGDAAYARLRQARVAVVGLGGVGSWAVEALARSGVASLVLFDLDHVAASNINRQVQALGSTLGMAKAQALRERILDIHPGCTVYTVEDFVQPENWPALLPIEVDVLIDACDQVRAKAALAAWALATGTPLVCVGAAGGKQSPQAAEVADLADVTHDPLLASLRQRLRKAAAQGNAPAGQGKNKWGVRCVFSREAVVLPNQALADGTGTTSEGAAPDSNLNCHGYGSSVMVTATFGLVAASEAIQLLLAAGKTAAPRTGHRMDHRMDHHMDHHMDHRTVGATPQTARAGATNLKSAPEEPTIKPAIL